MNAQVQLICTRMLIVLLVHPCVQQCTAHCITRGVQVCPLHSKGQSKPREEAGRAENVADAAGAAIE